MTRSFKQLKPSGLFQTESPGDRFRNWRRGRDVSSGGYESFFAGGVDHPVFHIVRSNVFVEAVGGDSLVLGAFLQQLSGFFGLDFVLGFIPESLCNII